MRQSCGCWILLSLPGRPQRSISVGEREKGHKINSREAMVPLQPFFLLCISVYSFRAHREGDWAWRAQGTGAVDRTHFPLPGVSRKPAHSWIVSPVPSDPVVTTRLEIPSFWVWIPVVPLTRCEKGPHYLGSMDLNFLMHKSELTILSPSQSGWIDITRSAWHCWDAVGILVPRKHAFPGAKPAFQNNGSLILQAFWEIQRPDFFKRSTYHSFGSLRTWFDSMC